MRGEPGEGMAGRAPHRRAYLGGGGAAHDGCEDSQRVDRNGIGAFLPDLHGMARHTTDREPQMGKLDQWEHSMLLCRGHGVRSQQVLLCATLFAIDLPVY